MRVDDLRRDWSREIDESRASLVPTTRPETPQARRADVANELAPRDGRASPALVAFVAHASVAATATDAAGPSRDAAVRQRLDAFHDAFSGPYRVTENGQTTTVKAPVMFRMNGTGFNQKSMLQHSAELVRIAQHAKVPLVHVYPAQVGCGSPEGIRLLTQALIDAGKLPPGPGDLTDRIKAMQWQYGIGVDCAGYTHQAIRAATGKSSAQLGIQPLGNEPFRMLDRNPSFAKVTPSTVRPGDIVTLDGPMTRRANGTMAREVGHNVVVRDRREMSANERAAFARQHGAPAASFFASAGPFHAIEVDSSWGAGPSGASYGGARRDTWLYDASTGSWASIDPSTSKLVVSATGPSGDDFHGAYRAKVTS